MKFIIWSIVIASIAVFAASAWPRAKVTIELPAHDPNVRYCGPSSALFPPNSVK